MVLAEPLLLATPALIVSYQVVRLCDQGFDRVQLYQKKAGEANSKQLQAAQRAHDYAKRRWDEVISERAAMEAQLNDAARVMEELEAKFDQVVAERNALAAGAECGDALKARVRLQAHRLTSMELELAQVRAKLREEKAQGEQRVQALKANLVRQAAKHRDAIWMPCGMSWPWHRPPKTMTRALTAEGRWLPCVHSMRTRCRSLLP